MCLLCGTGNIQQTIYCERGLSAGFLAEPINAISNLTFPILGIISYRFLKKNKINDKQIVILPFLFSIIGFGSFLYHTTRSSITLILDFVTLYFFILYTIFLVLNFLLRSKIKSATILLGFIFIEIILSIYVPGDFLNGSIRHLAAIVFVMGISLFVLKSFGRKMLYPLVGVIGFYAIAIFFRSIDMVVCELLPLGTHFLWHVFAALAGYSAIITIARMRLYKRNSSVNTRT